MPELPESATAYASAPRALLVDDFAPLRETMAQLLRAAMPPWCVTEAAGGPQALECLDAAAFDVAVVDLSMPDMNGFELTRRIRARHPAVPVLVLSMHEEEPYALKALQSGARGYLMKDRAGTDLVAAVNEVVAGGVHLSARLAERWLADRGHGMQIARHATLSGREFEVLRRLARGESPPAIATALTLAASVVTTSCQRIMAKLELGSLADMVRYGVDHGLGAPRPPRGSPPPPPLVRAAGRRLRGPDAPVSMPPPTPP